MVQLHTILKVEFQKSFDQLNAHSNKCVDMVIGAFYYVHVVKSIPWTVIACWPMNGHIYISAYFSNGVGTVLSHSLSAYWTLVGTPVPVNVVIIIVYSAH